MTGLDRFYAWLVDHPSRRLDDPRWTRGMLRAGDVAEITTPSGFTDRCPVVSATSRAFKISDGRVFDQRGWSTLNGCTASVRARKVKA